MIQGGVCDWLGHPGGWSLQLPPCLKNRLFTKLVNPGLGVPAAMEPVAVDLDEFNARDGCILESSIDQQGGTEVSPLLI